MKPTAFVLAALAATTLIGVAYAITTTIDVAARLRVGLSFANQVNMNFTPSTNHIDFYGTPAGTDHVNLGTDGAMTVDGSVFQPSSLTGTPASVDLNGDNSSAVYISCDTQATLAEATSATTIVVDSLQIATDTAKAYASPDYTCAGVDTTPHSFTLTGGNKIFMGGRLVGNSTIGSALYSTTDTADGGTAATLKVIYQ